MTSQGQLWYQHLFKAVINRQDWPTVLNTTNMPSALDLDPSNLDPADRDAHQAFLNALENSLLDHLVSQAGEIASQATARRCGDAAVFLPVGDPGRAIVRRLKLSLQWDGLDIHPIADMARLSLGDINLTSGTQGWLSPLGFPVVFQSIYDAQHKTVAQAELQQLSQAFRNAYSLPDADLEHWGWFTWEDTQLAWPLSMFVARWCVIT